MLTIDVTPTLFTVALACAVAGAEGLRLRRFGSLASDLAVDTSLPGPFAVTAVLAACSGYATGAQPDEASLWGMSVNSRVACLTALAGAETNNEFDFSVACPPPCAERIETSMTVGEVLEVASRATEAQFTCECDGHAFILRRPTGADQASWLAADYPDADTARSSILRELIVEGEAEKVSPAIVAELEQALDEHDPLLRCTIDVVCPFCGATSSHDLPLAETALGVLRGVQSRMTQAVHTIASRYGWSETDILSLPRWRRDLYLSLVEQERR
jgi:hypothetical protein